MFLIRVSLLALASVILSGCTFTLSPLMILMFVETPIQIEDAEDKTSAPVETQIASEDAQNKVFAKA